MNDAIAITTLAENTVNIGGLQGEHGLAFLVRFGRRKLLFDTGQTDLCVSNAQQMGLTLDDLEGVVLSHGHYDHTGGIAAVCEQAAGARLFMHPAATEPKYTMNADGSSRWIGMKEGSLAAIGRAGNEEARDSTAGSGTIGQRRIAPSIGIHQRDVIWTKAPCEVMNGIWVTGEIPRRTPFEDTGGQFYGDANCTEPDRLLDDQALFFETPKGTVVLLGCSHAGVANTLKYILELTERRAIYAVIGGMHLLTASEGRLQRTLQSFRDWDIKKISPAHCTGMNAVAQIWAAFPERCSFCPVGTTTVFERD
jgi:7,8-dihydropterin-6-yl-methyl-4-(beta-D-ribofuranosyl)aminobenzene 5'-phosphate synthase